MKRSHLCWVGISLSVVLSGQAAGAASTSSEEVLNGAQLMMRQGECKKAIPLFRKAKSTPATAEPATVGLVRCQIEIGEATEAKTTIESYLSSDNPFSVDARIAYAEVLQKGQDYTGAIRELTSAEKLRPGYWAIAERRGLVLIDQKNYLEGIPTLAGCLSDRTGVWRSRTVLAQALLKTARYSEATEQAKLVIEERPSSTDAYLLWADSALGVKNYSDAERALKQVVKLNASLAEAWKKLANVSRLQGKVEAALGHYQQAVMLAPLDKDLAFELGQYHAQQNQHRLAEESWLRALRIDPAHEAAGTSLLKRYIAEGRNDQAGAFLKGLLDKNPRLGWALRSYAVLTADLGQPELGGVAVQRAMTGDDGQGPSATAWVIQAWLHLKAGKREEARKSLEDGLKRAPQDGYALYNLAILATQDKKPEAAARYFAQVPETHTLAYKAKINLALIHEQAGKKKEALDVLQAVKSPESIDSRVRAKVSELKTLLAANAGPARIEQRVPASVPTAPAPSEPKNKIDGVSKRQEVLQ